MKISYLIGTHNEGKVYLEPLLTMLLKHKDEEDEVIIFDDFSDEETTLETLKKFGDKVMVIQSKFQGDFSKHKNLMNTNASGNYIFNVDGDELPSEILLKTLKEILNNNPDVDLFYVPRINIVKDLPDEYLNKWNWVKNDQQFINFPDFQGRIYKNKPHIKWQFKVHESITGASKYSSLPSHDDEHNPYTDYCLLHVKSFERQLEQNTKYETIK